MDWIVTGSAPSGREWTRRLVRRYPDAIRIASNRAIEWYAEDGIDLDYLFVFDFVACQKYADIAKRMQQDGTRCVTLKRKQPALAQRNLDGFDEFIGPPRFKCNPGWFKRGEWNDMALSGLWCVQYAINSGATTLHLSGHDGYRGRPTDYDSGEAHPNAAAKTYGVIQPGFQAMIDACPDVQFAFYGDLAYDVKGVNATRVQKQKIEPATA
jgi:hypothetical protein